MSSKSIAGSSRIPMAALSAGALLALALVGYLLFGVQPTLPRGTVSAIADETVPEGLRQEGETRGGGFGFKLVSLESHVQSSASSSSWHEGGNRWLARSVAIYNHDDSVLMQRAGYALFEAWRDSGRFESVRYLPAGERLAYGTRLPDLFVSLELADWKQFRLPGYTRYDGEIVVSVSDQYRRPRFFVAEDLDPPIVPVRWDSLILYRGKQLGFEMGSSRYDLLNRVRIRRPFDNP